MSPAKPDRRLRVALQTWLLLAEREYRFAQVAVRDGTDESRRRYAAARRDLDLAGRVTAHLLAWPTAIAPSA